MHLLAHFNYFFSVIFLYKWIVIISALLTWVRPDPYNPIVQMLYRLTEPVYAKMRQYIPTTFGGMDLAPLILIFALIFLETFYKKFFYRFMLKIFKVSLLFSFSLNLFANSITTDFMQKDFKITL